MIKNYREVILPSFGTSGKFSKCRRLETDHEIISISSQYKSEKDAKTGKCPLHTHTVVHWITDKEDGK